MSAPRIPKRPCSMLGIQACVDRDTECAWDQYGDRKCSRRAPGRPKALKPAPTLRGLKALPCDMLYRSSQCADRRDCIWEGKLGAKGRCKKRVLAVGVTKPCKSTRKRKTCEERADCHWLERRCLSGAAPKPKRRKRKAAEKPKPKRKAPTKKRKPSVPRVKRATKPKRKQPARKAKK